MPWGAVLLLGMVHPARGSPVPEVGPALQIIVDACRCGTCLPALPPMPRALLATTKRSSLSAHLPEGAAAATQTSSFLELTIRRCVCVAMVRLPSVVLMF